MDRTIIEMEFFDGMDVSSKRELSSIKVPMKYSSESWMSSWKLFKSLLEPQFACQPGLKCFAGFPCVSVRFRVLGGWVGFWVFETS